MKSSMKTKMSAARPCVENLPFLLSLPVLYFSVARFIPEEEPLCLEPAPVLLAVPEERVLPVLDEEAAFEEVFLVTPVLEPPDGAREDVFFFGELPEGPSLRCIFLLYF